MQLLDDDPDRPPIRSLAVVVGGCVGVLAAGALAYAVLRWFEKGRGW